MVFHTYQSGKYHKMFHEKRHEINKGHVKKIQRQKRYVSTNHNKDADNCPNNHNKNNTYFDVIYILGYTK